VLEEDENLIDNVKSSIDVPEQGDTYCISNANDDPGVKSKLSKVFWIWSRCWTGANHLSLIVANRVCVGITLSTVSTGAYPDL